VAAAAETVAEHELEQRILHATTVATVSQADQARLGTLAPPQPLSADNERRHRSAVLDWKHAAEQQLQRCVQRPAQDRHPAPLQVGFFPRPRAPGDPRQVLVASWVTLPSQELTRLWQDTPARALEACLDQVRSIEATVPLTGEALTHAFPASTENVLIEL
jgi:hypothetical protein